MKKNYDRFLIILLILVFIVLLGLYIKDTLKTKKSTNINNDVVEKIENYDYSLKNNSSELYKKTFANLKEVLEGNKDEEEYAKLVAQLFIIDFYTLDGKISNNDVGGLDFVLSEIKDNFILKANETMYKYVENTTYGEKKDELPIVSEVEVVDLKNVSYTYNKTTDKKAYEIKVKFDYKKDLGYEKEKTLYFVHSDNLLFLVEMK